MADQVAVLLLAGIKTTSTALTWCLYLISEHPEVQKRLCEESDQVLGGTVAGWDDLLNLPYAHSVQRRADSYVEPQKFDPLRWMGRPPAPQGGFITFGLGVTKCVGGKFAVNEAVLALASISGRFNIRRDVSVKVRAKAKTTLEPSKFVAIFSPRQEAASPRSHPLPGSQSGEFPRVKDRS
ncbi:cytochrome P450 [Amycolatopsis pithecellobii]|uniref:cytochrome P450 n=1 Tax=Amycolatopsis pithecellobii TaxID=664692 RepID=UPI00140C20EE|nr:cytochrome P450 [Amycolatopsis pithecellobii]